MRGTGSQDPLVRNPVFDELQRPFAGDGLEEPADVCVEHPAHLLPLDRHRDRIQRIVLAAPTSESVGETGEVGFIGGLPPDRLRSVRRMISLVKVKMGSVLR